MGVHGIFKVEARWSLSVTSTYSTSQGSHRGSPGFWGLISRSDGKTSRWSRSYYWGHLCERQSGHPQCPSKLIKFISLKTDLLSACRMPATTLGAPLTLGEFEGAQGGAGRKLGRPWPLGFPSEAATSLYRHIWSSLSPPGKAG